MRKKRQNYTNLKALQQLVIWFERAFVLSVFPPRLSNLQLMVIIDHAVQKIPDGDKHTSVLLWNTCQR